MKPVSRCAEFDFLRYPGSTQGRSGRRYKGLAFHVLDDEASGRLHADFLHVSNLRTCQRADREIAVDLVVTIKNVIVWNKQIAVLVIEHAHEMPAADYPDDGAPTAVVGVEPAMHRVAGSDGRRRLRASVAGSVHAG